MTKKQYIQNAKIIRNRIEKYFQPKVRQIIQDQFDAAAKVVKTRGVEHAQGHINHDVVHQGLVTVIRNLYVTAARMALTKPFITMKEKKSLPDFLQKIIDYLNVHLLEKVVLPISQTTIKDIDRVLQKAIDGGWGVYKTVSELEESDIPDWRAKMIVRTETVRAANFAQLVAADDKDFEMEKQWIATEDARTRVTHSHQGVDGQRRDLYEPYSNGCMFPGDPNASAKETVNCRCTEGYFAKRDLDGNLVPRTKKDIDILTVLNTTLKNGD